MTAKKCISFLTMMLLLSACHTSKVTQNPSKSKTNGSHVEVNSHHQSGHNNKHDEDKLARTSRAYINNVEAMPSSTWQGKLQHKLDEMTHRSLFETTQLGMCVFDLTDDRMLYAVNADHRMRPASNQKLVTAITALDRLGTNYRFRPTVLFPGWGWCWDDEETGMTEFDAKGKRWNADTLYYEKYERKLGDVLVPMMKKSDNLLAESIFWQLTAERDLKKVKRKDCVARVDEVLKKAGVSNTDYVIADGSGLSLYDYLSPRLLLMLLRHAYQDKEIYDALYSALPIAGKDGTLAKRMKGTTAEGNVHAKTGTVTGVSSLSGYCKHPSGHILAFSIINQGIPKSSVGRDYQDKVCELLTRGN